MRGTDREEGTQRLLQNENPPATHGTIDNGVAINVPDVAPVPHTFPRSVGFYFFAFLSLGLLAATAMLIVKCVFLMRERFYPQLGGLDCHNSFLGEYEPCSNSVMCTDVFGQSATYVWNNMSQTVLSAICNTLSVGPSERNYYWITFTYNGETLRESYTHSHAGDNFVPAIAFMLLALLSCLVSVVTIVAASFYYPRRNQGGLFSADTTRAVVSTKLVNELRLDALMHKGLKEETVPERFLCVILKTIMTNPVWDKGSAKNIVLGLNADESRVPRVESSVYNAIIEGNSVHANGKNPFTMFPIAIPLIDDEELKKEIDDFLSAKEKEYGITLPAPLVP